MTTFHAKGASRSWMCGICVLALWAGLLLFSVAFTDPDLHLHISHTNFVQAVSQPASGLWNPANGVISIPADAVAGTFSVFCGETIAVTFPTKIGFTYQCEASDDGLRTWLRGSLQVIGTGGNVSLYDTPHPKRSYRVVKQPIP